MRRSLAAVLAGLIVAVVMVIMLSWLAAVIVDQPESGPPTRAYLALNLLGGALAGMAGGATAAWMAPHTPRGHAYILAAVILLLSLPGLFSAPLPGQPSWYPLALSVLGPASVVIGGVIALRRRRLADLREER